MEKIADGWLDSAIELGKELCKKYGVPDEDWEALFAVISDEDHQMLVDELCGNILK